MKIELDLFNYVKKVDLKYSTDVDKSKFAKSTDLTNLKWEIDKLDIDKLEITLADLTKLKDVVKNEFFLKTVFDKLIKNQLMLFRLLILAI